MQKNTSEKGMKKKRTLKVLPLILALTLTLTSVAPTTVLAAEVDGSDIVSVEEIVESGIVEDVETDVEVLDDVEESTEDSAIDDVVTEDVTTEVVVDEAVVESTSEVAATYNNAVTVAEGTEENEEEEQDEEPVITDYAAFLSALKVLEGYADTYAREHAGEDEIELVLNFIRTGVAKYVGASWDSFAGVENKDFVTYVATQDAANGTNATDLRSLGEFTAPNGDEVDFQHMFGCMNITYYMARSKTAEEAVLFADMSGWGGDTADLMEYTVDKVTSTDVEAMAAEIKENYLGVDDDTAHGFGLIDMRGDLDAYYIANSLGGGKAISKVIENYFNKNLTDKIRATYFVENRFAGSSTQDEIREALYTAYSDENNEALRLVERSKGVADKTDLRMACCYAFADWLFEQAGIITDLENNDYYSVYSSEKSTLAPGVTQEIKKATTADDKQIVYYIATADVTRDDVSVHANYKENIATVQGDWGMARVMDQMQAAIKNHTDPSSENYVPNYQPVVGTNGDFFNMTTGEPSGILVMEGVKYHNANSSNFFAILKDGTPIVASGSEYESYADDIQEAIGGSIWLVKNGKLAVTATSDYYTSRASRTCVGITADNKVVLMVLDGRQEPVSAGGSSIEIAQIMLDAGCVNAINLDGGGSTTYIAKEEGSDELSVVNNPSDGYDRSVSSSLMVVSTARPSTEFDHALVLADSDYLTVGTSVSVTASGVSASGGSAALPEGSYLKVTDESVGTLADGVFTAKATGDVTIQLVNDEKVLGKKTLHVVVPNELAFEKEHFNVVYGVATELPLMATYNGNRVAINDGDVAIALEAGKEAAGTINGLYFTGNEASGIRSVTAIATLTSDTNATATTQIDMFNEGEAVFDFENATGGDRKFAWKRVLTNTNTSDEVTYYIDNREEAIEGSYTFALDMKEIPLPTELESIIGLLPGADDADSSAWNFLLQLAERISVLTEVTVTVKIDEDFILDYTDITLVNEYFELTSTDFDEKNNTLTIKFNWIDQTQPIDPATANSMCILSGIKFIPKEGTDEVIDAVMSGSVDYNVFLRSSTVYGLAADPEMQKLGLKQFINPNDSSEKGASFEKIGFVEMTDTFTVDMMDRNGWMEGPDGKMYYYVENVALEGIQLLPDMNNPEVEVFYDLGDEGLAKGDVNKAKITGLFEYQGDTYYAIAGVAKTSCWWSVVNAQEKDFFYFDKEGKAVDGVQKIDGYTYTFEDNILVRGEIVKSEKGIRYMWAGSWATQEWLEIDGNISYAKQGGWFATGIYNQYDVDGVYKRFVFDENGVWLQDQTGLYEWEGELYLTENGLVDKEPQLVKIGSYYYFFVNGTAIRNTTKWVNKSQTNGLLPGGSYTFDEKGRMVVDGDVTRIYGATRYETCFQIADTLKEDLDIKKFDTVIVASGTNFADALAGSYLAAVKDAPILMTDGSDKYNKALHDYIKANVVAGGKVYILGGTAALPTSVDAGLTGYDVVRLAGETRYETNLAILEEAGVADEEVLICTGESFADSLSASATGKPILLMNTKKNILLEDQKEFLASVKGNKLYIIGGTSAIDASLEKEIKAYGTPERIGGATRYETSTMLAAKFFADPSRAVLAYAQNFPDGLCGGPLAYSMGAPLILTDTAHTTAAIRYVDGNEIGTGAVLGGTILISDKAVRKVYGLDSKATITVKK